MNNRRKMNRGRKQNGLKSRKSAKGFLPLKKNRGKINKRNTAVKVHSVSDVDFVISTSFAKYKIPRSISPFFEKANQREIRNIEFYRYQTYRFECGYGFSFYWVDLDTLIDAHNLKEFEINE